MITIVNAKLSELPLATLVFEPGGNFVSVTPQKQWVKSADPMVSLTAYVANKDKNPTLVDAGGELLVAAACDMHVHCREPGAENKETWKSLADSAFKGGVVAIGEMPNNNPPTINEEALLFKQKMADETDLRYKLYLGVCCNNLKQIPALLAKYPDLICGLKIYYGNSTGNLMFADLESLHTILPGDYDGILAFHSEDQCRIDQNELKYRPDLIADTSPHSYAIHSKLRDSESAFLSTKVILDWSMRNNRKIHIAHISTPREVELLIDYKEKGLDATWEVCPHHLIFSIEDYETLGSKIKVNPPIRSRAEVLELRQYFGQQMIDCLASDHAPHLLEEKERPYAQCPSGLPAIEFFWPLATSCSELTGLKLKGIENMVGLNPSKMLGFKQMGNIEKGFKADFVWLSSDRYRLRETDVEAKCSWSPYIGKNFSHRVMATWSQGYMKYGHPSVKE